MSQFILYRGRNQKIAPLETETYPFVDTFLNTVSKHLWKDANNSLSTVLSYDQLCTDAQELMQKNIPFESTKLFLTLKNILEHAEEIILWYGEYYQDLPQTTDQNEFLKIIKDSIQDPTCETYIWYTKK